MTIPTLGRSFLPAFNEGSLTVGVVSTPGIPLADSDALGRRVEEALLGFPEVISTSRRTGRAEKDEHVQGVNASEMEVVLGPLDHGRDKEALLAEMRRAVSTIPGVVVSFGQPISHRIDHMISGSKTNLAVKVFGPDLAVLRGLAGAVESTLRSVPGIVDLSNQEQAAIPSSSSTSTGAAWRATGSLRQQWRSRWKRCFRGSRSARSSIRGSARESSCATTRSCAARASGSPSCRSRHRRGPSSRCARWPTFASISARRWSVARTCSARP